MSVDVETLTREHKTAVSTDEGIEFHSVPSLLSQLRDAVFGGMESTGGSSAMKSKLPISAAALDLYMEIDREITRAWVVAFQKVPNADNPEGLLAQWGAWATAETITEASGRTYYAPDAVNVWEQRIVDFFDPPRMAEIDAECPMPECGNRYVFTTMDGEEIRSSALRFNRSRHTGETLDARCLACGTIWQRTDFDRLATVIGIDVEKKRQDHFDTMSEVDGSIVA